MFLNPVDPNDETNMERKLEIKKHRGGKKDVSVDLIFFAAQSRFGSMAKPDYYTPPAPQQARISNNPKLPPNESYIDETGMPF